MTDPETCSRCLNEVEDADLTDVPATGERICRACLDDLPDDEYNAIIDPEGDLS